MRYYKLAILIILLGWIISLFGQPIAQAGFSFSGSTFVQQTTSTSENTFLTGTPVISSTLSLSYPSPQEMIKTITEIVTHHPAILNSKARLLSVEIQGEVVVIDLSREILPGGDYSPIPFQQISQTLNDQLHLNRMYMTTYKVENKTLNHWGMSVPQIKPISNESISTQSGPLAGRTIALNPGHGRYNTSGTDWNWQRGWWWGIIEDLVNAEIQMYVAENLTSLGATVIYLREPDKNISSGDSGLPRWQEATRHYLQYQQLPASIWDYSGCGSDNLCKDIMARPYGANYYGADLLISLHNNGGGGTGTETWYDTTGDYHDVPTTQNLAQNVHNRVISTIRNHYNSAWPDRGVKPSAGDYGENHFAQMPAILIELAFMDTQYPDNNALQDEVFKELSAKAIVLGICDYYGTSCPTIMPVTPTPTPTSSPLTSVEVYPNLTPPAPTSTCGNYWYALNDGTYDAWLTLNAEHEGQSTNSGTWRPNIPKTATYKVEAYIASHNKIDACEFTYNYDTNNAKYTINHAGGSDIVTANQQPVWGWLNLGNFQFNAGTSGSVELTDLTGEVSLSRVVSFSKMRFTCVSGCDEPTPPPTATPTDTPTPTATPIPDGPLLTIPTNITAYAGQPVQVPIQFNSNNTSIASTAFSLDFDETCLLFDETDANSDGQPDAISFNLPSQFSGGVSFDSTDIDGELDFTLGDYAPPLSALPDQLLATITFIPKSSCKPVGITHHLAEINFSTDPAASFGSITGQSLDGTTSGGTITIANPNSSVFLPLILK